MDGFTPRSQNSHVEEGRQSFPELFHREQIKTRKEFDFEKQLPSSDTVYNSVIFDKVESANRFRTNRPVYGGFKRQTSVKLPNLNSRPQTCGGKESHVKIPSFVQLETLRAGQCFVSLDQETTPCNCFERQHAV